MSEDPGPSDANEPYLFRFVAPGMRLTHELESIGQLQASLGHSIEFCPVVTVVGWNNQKQILLSLRLKHLVNEDREISRCLLDRDEALVWANLLSAQLGACVPVNFESFRTHDFEYVTRHGIRWTWNARGICGQSVDVLYVASKQSAIFAEGFYLNLLEILANFEALCAGYV